LKALPVQLGDIIEVELSPPYKGRMGAYQLKVERAELVEPVRLEPGDFSHGIVLYPYPVIHMECSTVGRRHDRGYYTIRPQAKGDWLCDAGIDQCDSGFLWAFRRYHIVKRSEKKREKRFAQGELFA